MKPSTLKELDEWAQASFPDELAVFKAEVDKIMTPTSTPYGYDPNDANGPKAEYKDWIMPIAEDRTRLYMQSYLILVIGSFKKKEHPTITDKLFVYMSHGECMNFGRMVYEVGSNLPTYVRCYDLQATMTKDIFLFPFWKRISSGDPKYKFGNALKTAALYLHLVRQLLSDFRGPHASKLQFEYALKAFTKQAQDQGML